MEALLIVLVVLEYLLLVGLLAWVWTRSRTRPRRFVQLVLGVAVVAQAAVLIGVNLLMERAFADPATAMGAVPRVARSVLPLQALRAVLLLGALLAWLRLIRDDLSRKSIWIPMALGILFIATEVPALYFLGGIVLIFALARLSWAGRVTGIWRFLSLLISPVLAVLFMFNFAAVVGDGTVTLPEFNISNAPSTNLLMGESTGSAAVADRLMGPWDRLIFILCDLLRLHFFVAFFKFLVLPVHLRGLSLKRRFAVTTALYRLVPGTLGLIAVILGIYFGMGIHKTRMIRVAFDLSVDDAGKVVERILADPMLAGGAVAPAAGRAALEVMRPWLGVDAERAHLVLRRTDLAPGDTTRVAQTLSVIATAGAPNRLLEQIPFPITGDETLGGMVVGDETLFLAAARSRPIPGGALTAEVYVQADSVYLSRAARRVGADLRLQAIPRLMISSNSVIMSSRDEDQDSTWTATRFEIRVPATADTSGTGLWRGRRYLARQFVPVGDWLQTTDDERRGAVLMALETSPESLVNGLFSQPYVLPSNIFATATFMVILVLFVIAELSAVRTGASIIRGILDDVRALTRAATRIGEGDLDHRIEIKGKDELGSLGATFNDMAANLKRHQAEMLEKERLEADLALARQIQERLLPQDSPQIVGLDVAGISIPSREVGGDLFYFLPQDGKLGVAIGDVSGKSVPAALLMSNVLAALRAETRFAVKSHEILGHINEIIAQQVESGRFVTFIYGVVEEGRFDYSCAGHNPPLLMNAAGEGKWLEVSGLALGILPGSEYTPASAELRPGDVLVLYSDGVTEAERSPVEALMAAASAPATAGAAGVPSAPDSENGGSDEDLEFFEEERLLDTVRDARHLPAAEIVQGVLDAVREFTGDVPQSDDLTLVVIKVRGAD